MQQVILKDAKGINILGCSFSDETGELTVTGIGIYNSGAEIGPYFLPPQPTVPSTFNNLYTAIYVGSAGTFTRVVVQQNDISGCYMGITGVNPENLILLDNNIHDPVQLGSGIAFGVGATGFTVEGNTIKDYYTGIYLESISPQDNEIYRNTISNYEWGIDYISSYGSGMEGLRVLCNDMSHLNASDYMGIEADGKMATDQGVPDLNSVTGWESAGNLFADINTYINPQMYRANTIQVASFNYYYSNINPAEYPGNTNFPLFLASPNGCPVHQPPIIKPHFYTLHLASLENQIFTLTNKPILSAEDSSQLSGLLYEHQKLIDSMTYTILDSKDSINYDSLAYAFEQIQYGYYNKIRLAGIYLTQLKYDSAINLLNSIPENFSLTEEQQTDIHNMADMYTVIDSLAHNGDNWDSLSDYMIQEVHTVANDYGNYGKGVALYLLGRYEGYEYVPNPPANPQSYQMSLQPLLNKNNIYPNPTDGQLFINWQSNVKLSIKIYSMKGEIVLTKKIQSGLSNIDIHALPAGVYSVHIYEDGKSVYQQNIVKK